MRIVGTAFLLVALFGFGPSAFAASGRIHKLLPHRLDRQGRHTLAPSLYERDAYQAYLRRHPEECSALRFDVQWKAKGAKHQELKLRVELRTSGHDPAEPLVLERAVEPKGRFSRWSSLSLEGEPFKKAGSIIAWRATLWLGDSLLAEQKSFLW